MVTIEWLGHACFLIRGSRVSVIIDPFAQESGLLYPAIDVHADVVLVSHEHLDHNCVAAVRGAPRVIRGQGEWSAPMSIRGITANHDASGGALRGKTTIYAFELDGISFCHLGDLGEIPTDEVVRRIGAVDVLMIPVGGFFTIDHEGADTVVDMLRPKLVIPMHYKTEFVTFQLDPVDKFISGKKEAKFQETNSISVDRGALPARTEIVVLAPPGARTRLR